MKLRPLPLPLPSADLSALRALRGLTQEELAARLGVAQSNVSRLERRADMRVSTLRDVVEKLGGELQLVAAFPEGAVRIRPPEPRAAERGEAGAGGAGSVEARLRRFFEDATVPGVVSAYLFGGVASGREHAESDVDVAVLLDRGRYPDPSARSGARIDLGSALVHVLGRNEVDLVVLNDAPPELARRIVVEGRRVAQLDPVADHAFVRDAQLRAADLAPFLARMRRIKLEALRS